MHTLANGIWGARCGKSARRVLLGETRLSGHAYSVRGARESVALRQAPHGLPSSRLVSTILLDEWFETVVKPRLKGEAYEIRYADDFILCFQYREDAEKVLEVLRKRFSKYGLTLHPDKTRLMEFGRKALAKSEEPGGTKPATFDFLGFTHLCQRTRKGKFTIHVRTMRKRLRRSLKNVTVWCREHRHDPVEEQQAALNRKLRGHYQYYGRSSNSRGIGEFYECVKRIWQKWLNRRTRGNTLNWLAYTQLLKRHPLLRPRLSRPWKPEPTLGSLV
jgi:hypothetical protein